MTQLIQLEKADAEKLVNIHINAFPNFFLTALGKNVLHVFYTSLLLDRSTIAFGVKNGETLIGFLVASTSANGLYLRIFKKNILRFTFPLAISFLKNMNLLKRMFISFSSLKSHQFPLSYTSSLLSICVNPEQAGKGIGKMLLNALETELMAKGQPGYYLTTDSENNEPTNQFYLKNGFELHSTYMQGKRKMNLYLKLLQ